ncbi:MAG TPA: glycosyltransferase [Bryobacteraceae bacterium]|nr:glycosyltransferase [Bryobacteraceae bacterium]
MARVCAVIVTANRKDLLRRCLRSVLAQTRPADRILVVDNASTDGTREMLDSEFGNLVRLNILARLDLRDNVGGAGGVSAGMRWAHCNKFDWTWVLDDGVELAPDCLRRMLAAEDAGDLIQVLGGAERHHAAFPDNAPWAKVDYCDFTSALIRRKVIEAAGFPDIRYFHAGDDIAYGYLAAQRTSSICLNYQGIQRHTPATPPLDRMTFYLGIRNRFLNRANLAESGGAPSSVRFFFEVLGAVVRQLGRALESANASINAIATIDGLRDGLHKRFDRLPQS